MKKGFTLAELLGVLVILGAILLIAIPVVDQTIKSGKEDLYQEQIDSIKTSLQLWMSNNQKPDVGEKIVLSLSQLKESGAVALDITNPKTNELFPNDMILEISNNNGIIEYEVDVTGNNKEDYTLLPSISLNGNVLEYVEVDSTNVTTYDDSGVIVKDSSGNVISTVSQSTTPTFDITKRGIYLRKYTATFNGYTNVAYRTIIVRDTTGPEIGFVGSLTLTYEESRTYDYDNDIVVTDNSGENVTVTVEHNISPLVGDYTIEYIATDSSGNVTTKSRKVTITE